MANPFDEIVNSDKKGQKKEVKEEGNEHKKAASKNDEINVSFSVNKRWLERIFFLAIIMAELYFILANPVCNIDADNKSAAESDVPETAVREDEPAQEESPAADEQQPEEATEGGGEEKPAEEDVLEEEGEEEEADLPFEGNFDLKVDSIDYAEDEEGNPLTIESIKLSMTNRWKDFIPKIKIYWYADSAEIAIKEMVRLEKSLGSIERGKKYKFTLNKYEFSPKFFLSHGRETVKVELYDRDSGELLDTVRRTVS
ncbi:hypothetical protein GF323_00945 [Candidatus Woesearchaeota archaeon]|nr:hypothetical protein [Candidatus Woesearchaeota archaeon]